MSGRLTPGRRASLIERAKRAAMPVSNCVAASVPPSHILAPMSRDELAALVIVLAEAVDHAKLKAVTETADDGRPEPRGAVCEWVPAGAGDGALREAHAEAARLRKAGQAVPPQVRILDNAYTAKDRVRVAPDPDAEAHRQALADALAERQAS